MGSRNMQEKLEILSPHDTLGNMKEVRLLGSWDNSKHVNSQYVQL